MKHEPSGRTNPPGHLIIVGRDATRNGARYIMVVAHWKAETIAAEDIRPGLQAAIEIFLRERPGMLPDELARMIGGGGRNPADVSERITAALNELLKSQRIGPPFEARNKLDAWFSDSIVPGNVVELRDGFHKADALADCIANQWSGIFDLSVCHSYNLAIALKAGRADRRVITNELQKDPDRCIREHMITLLLLSRAFSLKCDSLGFSFRHHSDSLVIESQREFEHGLFGRSTATNC